MLDIIGAKSHITNISTSVFKKEKKVKTKAFLSRITSGIAAVAMLLTSPMALAPVHAACQLPTNDYGQASTSIATPSSATYRIWTRMMAPDTTNTTYLLEVDGTQCYVVGGGLPANSWAWVAYQNGSAASTIDLALTKGTHTLRLIGRQPGVKVDRIIMVSDLTCVPTGMGDNCNVPDDTTPPSVALTAPAEGSTVSGNAVKATATASDNVGVTKVEFYVNSTLKATGVTAPYTFTWDTTSLQNGQQLIMAKAYDAAGNSSTSSYSVTVQNGDTQAPTVPTSLAATAPAYNKVALTWNASTDNVGVQGYNITRNGALLAKINAVTTYQDNTVAANTQYTYQVSAFDAAGNTSGQSSIATVKTPTVADTQAPTAPSQLTATAASSQQINLKWGASTDNVDIVAYDVYRGQGTNTPQKVATITTNSYGDTGLSSNTQYSYYVKARDSAGNTSAQSNTASATTLTRRHHSRIFGVVSGSVIPNAQVTITIEGIKYTTTTNQQGYYLIRGVPAGRYNVSYNAAGHYSKTISITVTDSSVEKNVRLQRK
jgi:chitodextrinase